MANTMIGKPSSLHWARNSADETVQQMNETG